VFIVAAPPDAENPDLPIIFDQLMRFEVQRGGDGE
jgi:hypothetical protein